MAPQSQRCVHCGSQCLALYTLLTSLYVLILPSEVTSEYAVGNQDSTDIEHDVTLFPHFSEHYDERNFGKLSIELVQATTSSIRVKWDLTNFTYPDSTAESTVICETFNGKIVSDKLHPSVNSFHFQYLHSNTKYIVCVYLVEKSKAMNMSILHYNCRPVSTIPVVRSDSIIGVILTLGYLFVMGGIGYVVWYRRTKKMRKKEEEEPMKIEESDDDEEEEDLRGRGGGGSSKRGEGEGGGNRKVAFANYAVDGGTVAAAAAAGADAAVGGADDDFGDDDGGGGGGGGSKDRNSSGDCTGGCSPFGAKEEEENVVQYNAKKREISF